MISIKRTVVKLALIGTLAGGIMGMPVGVSAAPNEHSCHAQWMSPGFQGRGTGKDWNPAMHAAAYGGTPADLSQYSFDVYCGAVDYGN